MQSMAIVTQLVNFIRSKGLCHREFHELLCSMDADFEDISYYTEVRWLSCGKALKRVFELKNAIQVFMKGKGNPIAGFRSRMNRRICFSSGCNYSLKQTKFTTSKKNSN